jgi:Na+(H+)/acetate symporter ActP
MSKRINIIFLLSYLFIAGLYSPTAAIAKWNCPTLEEKPIKIEAWISRKIYKDWKLIEEEMEMMGNTKTFIWKYPGENPSQMIAIGKCVPGYIAQHAIRSALAFTKGVNVLVHQTFVHDHWIGLATSMFSENQHGHPITEEEVRQLLDPGLDTIEFHKLYKKFATQAATIHTFGLDLPNPKKIKD